MACKLIVSAALIGILAMGYAQADDQFVMRGGGWDALVHTKSRLSKKDACIVDSHGINIVLIGAIYDGVPVVDLRVGNKSWSLPVNVKGNIDIVIGSSAEPPSGLRSSVFLKS